MGSADQHDFFDKLIEQLDTNSDPNTKTDVVFLRHANAAEVSTLITQLITGQTTAANRAGNKTTNGAARVTTPTPAPRLLGAGVVVPSR